MKTRTRALPCGFSLLELLISVAIMSIIIGLSLATFKSGLDMRERARYRNSVEVRGRTILARMTERIRTASAGANPFLRDTLRVAQPLGYRFVGRNIGLPDVQTLAEDPNNGYALGVVDKKYLGVDNDGDGRTDEDPWNGIDDDNDGLVDEDPATIPYDLLNFTTPLPNGGDLDIVELGYGIDPVFPNSLRERYRVYHIGSGSLRDFGSYRTSSGADLPILDNETAFANDAGALSDLADDVVGLDIHYTFRDGNGNLEVVNNWDTADPSVVNRELGRPPDTDASILSGLPMLVTISIWLQDQKRQQPPRMMQTSVAPANASQ